MKVRIMTVPGRNRYRFTISVFVNDKFDYSVAADVSTVVNVRNRIKSEWVHKGATEVTANGIEFPSEWLARA